VKFTTTEYNCSPQIVLASWTSASRPEEPTNVGADHSAYSEVPRRSRRPSVSVCLHCTTSPPSFQAKAAIVIGHLPLHGPGKIPTPTPNRRRCCLRQLPLTEPHRRKWPCTAQRSVYLPTPRANLQKIKAKGKGSSFGSHPQPPRALITRHSS
jgi:hypothetical protein